MHAQLEASTETPAAKRVLTNAEARPQPLWTRVTAGPLVLACGCTPGVTPCSVHGRVEQRASVALARPQAAVYDRQLRVWGVEAQQR